MRTYERFDLQIGLWVASSIFLALASTFICDTVSVFAQGSGIPEVKTILSGINFYKYLSLETLVAKVFGLGLIQAAGFLVGFQGPIIHCSTIVANSVMRLRYFQDFYGVGAGHQSTFTRRQLLNTAVACGVVCTFGTPYGGILLSVEICSSVYLISNLFKAFVCGTVAYFTFQQFHSSEGYFDHVQKAAPQAAHSGPMLHFAVLGVVLGYTGAFLIFASSKMIELKNSATIDVFRK